MWKKHDEAAEEKDDIDQAQPHYFIELDEQSLHEDSESPPALCSDHYGCLSHFDLQKEHPMETGKRK